MKKMTGLLFAIIAATFIMSAAGCGKSEEKPATTAEKIGDAVTKAGEQAGQAMEKAGEAMQEAGEKVKEAVKEGVDKMTEEKK